MKQAATRAAANYQFSDKLLIIFLYALTYGALFLLSDKIAGLAGFSLWFPAAGIRFALIFVFGWRFGLLAAVAEIFAQGVLGEWVSWNKDPLFIVAGIGGPPILYAIVVWLLSRFELTQSTFSKFPHVIWFLLAAILAPAITAPLSAGIQILGGRMPVSLFQDAALSFWVGDMIGLMMVAPPFMLGLVSLQSRSTKLFQNVISLTFMMEFFAALIFIWLTFQYAYGTLPSLRWIPLAVPVIGISLRYGFAGAGLIVLCLNIMVLGAASELGPDARVELQVFLALLSLTGLLLGGLVSAKAEAKAQLADQFKTIAHLDRMNTMGELATHIIHELAQPISTTSMYASGAVRMLEAGKLDKGGLLNVMALTAAETTRMQELIRRMKAFAKNGELVREVTTAQAVIEGIKPMIDMAAKQAKVKVSYDLLDEELSLIVDSIQVQQVILNLVRNSIEAMEASKQKELIIKVSCIEERNICISVTDTGPGMSAGLRPGETTKANGMGVGLQVVSTVVDAHGGKLDIDRNTTVITLKM